MSQNGERELPSGFIFSGDIKPSAIDNKAGLIAGIRIGMNFQGKYIVTAALFGMPTDNIEARFKDDSIMRSPVLNTNYWGIDLKYVINPHGSMIFSLSCLAGSGNLNFNLKQKKNLQGNDYDPDYGKASYFVLEPQLSAVLLTVNWYRISIGAGYHLCLGLNYEYNKTLYDNSSLSGPFGNISFEIGSF
jgi:hypothetical protein